MQEYKQATAKPSFETVSSISLPTRVITYAWGDAYVEDLLSVTIPALLAPGNLPYLASQVSCEKRRENTFESNAGREIIARTAPECGSRNTADPASSA